MSDKETTATQPGVVEGGEQETGATGTRSGRDDYLDQLSARRSEQVARDVVDTPTEVEEQKTEVAETTDNKSSGDDLGLAAQLGKQLDDGTIVLDAGVLDKLMVPTKVNGVEELVPATKALAQYQKSNAADVKLQNASQEAARILAEANAVLAEANEAATAATTVKQKKEAAANLAEAQEGLDAAKKSMFDALYSGDVDAASKSFDEAMDLALALRTPARAASATPDTAAIVDRAAQAVKQQLSVDGALTKLYDDYPELQSDVDLITVAERKRIELENAGIPRSQAILDAGDYVGAKFKIGKHAAGKDASQPESTTREQKLAAKQGLDEPNSTAARAASMAQLPQTASQVIAEMAARRVPQ